SHDDNEDQARPRHGDASGNGFKEEELVLRPWPRKTGALLAAVLLAQVALAQEPPSSVDSPLLPTAAQAPQKPKSDLLDLPIEELGKIPARVPAAAVPAPSSVGAMPGAGAVSGTGFFAPSTTLSRGIEGTAGAGPVATVFDTPA